MLRISEIFTPKAKYSTADWISSEFHLPEGGAHLSGQYDFYYTPYFLGVAAALDDPSVNEVDLMKAAQVGWTYFLIGYICKRIDTDPCPIMVLFAKEKDGKAFHDEKLVTTVQATPSVNRLMDIAVSRKSGNRWDFKAFPRGYLKLVGSNSPGNVKSTSSVGVGVVEEPDDTSENVKEQGNAIGLLGERLKRYPGSKLIVGGTPTLKGISKTEKRINQSDARVLPVTCHECGESHVLDWDNVYWDGRDGQPACDRATGEIPIAKHEVYGFSDPDSAVYRCPHCQAEWDDYQRQKNIRDTVFNAAAAGDPHYGWKATKPFHGAAGFRELSELYTCLPGTTLADVVRDYLNAEHLLEQGDESERIKFENQKLGRAYEYATNAPEIEELIARSEDYEELTVPEGAWVLTAGVDVQHNRLACTIWGHGPGGEMWLVYWGELYAKRRVTDPKDPVWDELHKLLFTPRRQALGFAISVSAVSIDASDGSTSEEVYSWVRPRQRHGVMAIKGASHDYGNKEIFTLPRRVDHKSKTKAARHGLQVYMVGTHKAKDLLIGNNGRITLLGSGPGRLHWYKGVRSDFFEQLLSEVKAPSRANRGKLVWQPKAGVRQEGLDCTVYALHAGYAIKLHLWGQQKWDEVIRGLMQSDLFDVSQATNDQPLVIETKPAIDLAALARELNG